MMQSYWSENPMVHFSVLDYSLADEGAEEHWDIPILADHWYFPQFGKIVIPYIKITNYEEVEMCLNEKLIYVSSTLTYGKSHNYWVITLAARNS